MKLLDNALILSGSFLKELAKPIYGLMPFLLAILQGIVSFNAYGFVDAILAGACAIVLSWLCIQCGGTLRFCIQFLFTADLFRYKDQYDIDSAKYSRNAAIGIGITCFLAAIMFGGLGTFLVASIGYTTGWIFRERVMDNDILLFIYKDILKSRMSKQVK